MHKKLIGILVLLSLVLSTNAFAKELKIGYVSMKKVFYEYKKTKDFNQTLEKEDAKLKKEIEKKTQGVRKFRDEIDLLSEEAKEKKQPQLREKIKALNDFRKSKVEGLLRKKEKMFKEIRNDILNVTSKYAAKNKYEIIFDEIVFVYSSKNYDITDKVIAELNR